MHADLTFRDFQHVTHWPYQGSEGVVRARADSPGRTGKPFFIPPPLIFKIFFATGGYILFYLLYTKGLHMIKTHEE
jgi:hypothetical protein